MTIYVVNFNDSEAYAAYTSVDKAKEVIWNAYEDEVSPEFRRDYGEGDRKTLFEENYIEDYAWISELTVYDGNGNPV